jgi:hypothetical protein
VVILGWLCLRAEEISGRDCGFCSARGNSITIVVHRSKKTTHYNSPSPIKKILSALTWCGLETILVHEPAHCLHTYSGFVPLGDHPRATFIRSDCLGDRLPKECFLAAIIARWLAIELSSSYAEAHKAVHLFKVLCPCETMDERLGFSSPGYFSANSAQRLQ